jgi:asparagine synthase (glutamine-hydrolysing)
MCGFSGFISPALPLEKGRNVLGRMGNTLLMRGPDEEGVWLSEDGTVGLVHRRLAVIELGPGGRQPMTSPSGRYVLIFNGEIYNHNEMRVRLADAGVAFRSHSDTEVLLASLEHWGAERTLQLCVGMFAFALWDREQRKLLLARDRFGEKPLYYGWQGGSFLFGSTVQALRQHPDWQGALNKDALALLIRYDYIPAPLSIYEGVSKLLPGTWLELAWRDGRWRENTHTYWSALATATRASNAPYTGSFEDAVGTLEDLLRQVLKGQMLADVPLGAFLSGGIDSSTVVALMQLESSQPVRTFTIGFDNPDYDESPAAEVVARHLGTAHTTCALSKSDVLDLIPRMPTIYDEPFADASQLPTALVSQVARRDVTVALSGDGGDEIFGGYNRYVLGERLRHYRQRTPLLARQIAAKGLRAVSPPTWDSLLSLLPITKQAPHCGEKLHKLADVMSSDGDREMYGRMTTFWLDGLPVKEPQGHHSGLEEEVWRSSYSFQEKMMLADTLSYLPDDILVKVDRAAMGFSLETRAPFLDHRLFEFVWSLPLSYRIRSKQGKSLLREVLYRHVPRALIERPKTGFSLPIGDYLRGPLREWAESLLSVERLSQEDYFDAVRVRAVWEQHLSGKFNRQYDLWSVLMFQAWRYT